MKTCTRCAVGKPVTGFSRMLGGRLGLAAACRTCAAARSAIWRKANTDRRAVAAASNREAAAHAKEAAREQAASRHWQIENPLIDVTDYGPRDARNEWTLDQMDVSPWAA